MNYPNSSGSQKASLASPAGACDAHMHIFDPSSGVANASLADYRRIQSRIGTSRAVVVQPRAHGTDNSVTLAAIAAMGLNNARGVAVVGPQVTDAELLRLHDGGIRGLRFTLYTAVNAITSFEMIEPLAKRIASLGWHVQLHFNANQIREHAAMLSRLPCTMVFDHMARLPTTTHPARFVVQQLIDQDRAWVKLSGPYLDSAANASNRDYEDRLDVARDWVKNASERIVWGSDWPHVTEPAHKPDDAVLFDLLQDWIPHAATRKRVLVNNPETLYGLPPYDLLETPP